MAKDKKISKQKTFNPEKYGMTVCFLCKGKGKLHKKTGGFSVCTACGGFGLIKKEPSEATTSVSKPALAYKDE